MPRFTILRYFRLRAGETYFSEARTASIRSRAQIFSPFMRYIRDARPLDERLSIIGGATVASRRPGAV